MTSQGETIRDWLDRRRHFAEFITHPNSQKGNSHLKDYSYLDQQTLPITELHTLKRLENCFTCPF